MKRLALIPLILLLVGCGSPYEVAPVSGTVTMNGKPLDNAVVVFQPDGNKEHPNPGPSSGGRTDSQGRFTLQIEPEKPGAVVGKHRVLVWTHMDATDDAQEFQETIPPRYNMESELRFEVPSQGTDQANFELKRP